MYRGLWDKRTKNRNKEPDLIEAYVSWAPFVQQRCQWSAANAGVTSAVRLHDATSAYPSTRRDVAKQAENATQRRSRRLGDEGAFLESRQNSHPEGERLNWG